jgi:hypothetical protein
VADVAELREVVDAREQLSACSHGAQVQGALGVVPSAQAQGVGYWPCVHMVVVGLQHGGMQQHILIM